MTLPSDELGQHWEELLAMGLASNTPPRGVGVIPWPGSGWRAVTVDVADNRRYGYLVEPVAAAIQAGADVERLLQAAGAQQSAVKQSSRWSARRRILLGTLFLPVWLVGTIPFRTHPDSAYTTGMALVGFMAFLAIPGFFIALFFQQWVVAGACVYWWLGASLLQVEFSHQGLYPY